MFQQFLEVKPLQLLHHKIIYLLLNALNWAKPGPGTTSCLQLFGIFCYVATKLFQADNYVVIISN